MSDVFNTIMEYFGVIEAGDGNHRYKSWEHCYAFFRDYARNKSTKDIETACLNLGFYLASWGMYRGSSFLLQKDYTIHKYAIGALMQEKYKNLWELDLNVLQRDVTLVPLIMELRDDLKRAYYGNITEVKGAKKTVNVTDTLVSKIILGTMGCVPAYDRYFNIGLKVKGISTSFSELSLHELIAFYDKYYSDFMEAQSNIDGKVTYPIMKLLDMYFWQMGMNNKDEEKSDTYNGINNHKDVGKNQEDMKDKSVLNMVVESVDSMANRQFSRAQLLGYIYEKYPAVNRTTLQCEIYRVTVNRASRINWHPNKQERITNSKYDLLFEIDKGSFEKYDANKHGLWEIIKDDGGKLRVREKE